ncbi:hypothetical protein C1H46_005002 [Malus baccata]|uniref:Uncharacterized protein n=1 Tax=Malus baccata TaxID=106549 RepID=A0A540NE90_MALBA|nr:hypothetical protein C1H46_005002 [Malus baccata]
MKTRRNPEKCSSSKRSHQQLQGTSKVISMASKGSCDPIDPIDPIVAPPLDIGPIFLSQ